MKEVVVVAMFEEDNEDNEDSAEVWKVETIASSTEDENGGNSGGCMCGQGRKKALVTVP